MKHSENILRIMQEKNITAYSVAKSTGIDQSLFSKWKSHPTSEISSVKLIKIADYLGCSVDYLLGKEPLPEKEPPTLEGELIDFDGFDYAMQNETKELSESDKQILLSLAKQLREAREKDKEKS